MHPLYANGPTGRPFRQTPRRFRSNHLAGRSSSRIVPRGRPMHSARPVLRAATGRSGPIPFSLPERPGRAGGHCGPPHSRPATPRRLVVFGAALVGVELFHGRSIRMQGGLARRQNIRFNALRDEADSLPLPSTYALVSRSTRGGLVLSDQAPTERRLYRVPNSGWTPRISRRPFDGAGSLSTRHPIARSRGKRTTCGCSSTSCPARRRPAPTRPRPAQPPTGGRSSPPST